MSNTSPENAPMESPDAPLGDAALALETDLNPRVEDFLDRVYARLIHRVPYEKRQEFRKEMRTHLEAMIEAGEKEGASIEEATKRAIQQFGRPRRLARDFLKAGGYLRETFEEAYRLSLAGFGLCTALFWLFVLIAMSMEDSIGTLERYGLDYPLMLLLYGLTPFLVGLTVGDHSPKRAIPGLALAGLTLAGLTWVVTLMSAGKIGKSMPVQMAESFLPLLAVWILLGVAGAGFIIALRWTVRRLSPRFTRKRTA